MRIPPVNLERLVRSGPGDGEVGVCGTVPEIDWLVGGKLWFPPVNVRCDKSGPVLVWMPPIRIPPRVPVGGVDPVDSPTPTEEKGLPPVRGTEDVAPPGFGWLVDGTIRFSPARFRLDESYLVLELINTT